MTIEVRNLTKRFDGKTIIDNVSFTIERGEFVSLLGPSGCGKTTTLRCIAGFETPDGGTIRINGESVADASSRHVVAPYQRNIGMVFQSYAIWPHLSVFENVAFPLRIRRVDGAEIERRVSHALEMVGLSSKKNQSAPQLSGGQQQRVAVARAIVQSPSIMLFDEPLSNLDANLRDSTRAEIRRIQRQLGVATLYVTHDQAEALSLSDRVLVMNNGRIIQEGDPKTVYDNPSHQFVAKAVGASNFLRVEIQSRSGACATVRLPGGSEVTVPATAGETSRQQLLLRPDRITLTADCANSLMAGSIVQRLFVGGHYEYLIAVGDQVLRSHSRTRFEEEDTVGIWFDLEDAVLVQTDRTVA